VKLTSAPRRTDAALMQGVQDGQHFALGELYERLALPAYRVAFSVCHDRDCAQDAVQDAFVSIWSSRATYKPERGSVEGWAMTIVRHRAIHLARSRSTTARRDEAGLDDQAARDDVPSDFAARDETEQLLELLTLLPPAQREVIRLGFFDGLTHEEIARRLALPPGTVKGRMRLGLTRLRCALSASVREPERTAEQASQGAPASPMLDAHDTATRQRPEAFVRVSDGT
jgi:RNA polymerase sigma-70 factor, ECF subfamily